MSGTLCAAPWMVHTVNANGTVGVCCINHEVIAHTHDELRSQGQLDSMKASMLAGKPVIGCEKCYVTEAAGAKSLRQMYNGMHSRIGSALYETDILWFDLSMGNKCNQACRICGPHNSTGWLKDLPGFKDMYWAHVNNVITYGKHNDNSDKVSEILRQMRTASEAFTVELKGGEPLYIDANHDLLKAMIEEGLNHKCRELRIMTNGTATDDGVLSLLRHFDSINLAISIDAVGPLHAYTRGANLSWDDCRRRWSRLVSLPNVTELRVSNTIYAYTVFNLPDLYSFVRSEFGQAVPVADALLHKPRYLSVSMLPRTLRDQARACLDISHPVAALLAADDDAERRIMENRFRAFTRKLDQLRGEEVAAHVPQLRDLMELRID